MSFYPSTLREGLDILLHVFPNTYCTVNAEIGRHPGCEPELLFRAYTSAFSESAAPHCGTWGDNKPTIGEAIFNLIDKCKPKGVHAPNDVNESGGEVFEEVREPQAVISEVEKSTNETYKIIAQCSTPSEVSSSDDIPF